jgi:hypothetical protein
VKPKVSGKAASVIRMQSKYTITRPNHNIEAVFGEYIYVKTSYVSVGDLMSLPLFRQIELVIEGSS